MECLSVPKTFAIVHHGRVKQPWQTASPRAQDAFILRMTMGGQWHVSVQDRASWTVLTVLSGSCVVQREGNTLTLDDGHVAMISGPEPYAVHATEIDAIAGQLTTQSSPPDSWDRFTVLPGQDCVTPDGQHVRAELHRGVRAWGNAIDGPDQILVGTFTAASEVAALMLAGVSLTRVDDETTTGWAQLIAREAEREHPVQSIVLDRLLDILTVHAIHAAGVQGSITHPGIAAAVAAMYENPAAPWTVESLARRAAMSRSSFARAFHRSVGTPPLAYLTKIRLARAADTLRGSNATLAQVAREVGYASPFALSNAFSRQYGMSPKRVRDQAMTAASNI